MPYNNPPRRRFPPTGALALALFGWGCATTPMPVDIPPDHPAHPAAAETPFTPPPNPFAEAAPPEESPSTPEDHGPHGHGHQGHSAAAPPPGGAP